MTVRKSKKAAALRYDQAKDMAPKLLAKGRGKVAENIIDLARHHNVPLYEDDNLVQVLEALDVDTHIPAELYQAVAEVLVFIYRMNQKYESL